MTSRGPQDGPEDRPDDRPDAVPPPLRRVLVLGSTGSIGTQTLDVIAHLSRLHDAGAHPTRYEVVGLAAGRDVSALSAQGARLGLPAGQLAIADTEHARPAMRAGAGAAESLVRDIECDIVVAAIVGVAGLPATLAAAELGRDIALANKATLVAAGDIMTATCRRTGARLLPVDSEHAALWSALLARAGTHWAPPSPPPSSVERLILTASGGAFRDTPAHELATVTPAQALNHPTWCMGDKVTLDTATLVNKGLELIEAHHLFQLPADRLDAVIHPQSIVHSFVEARDGSVLAQLGPTDMRLPIQQALAFPLRTPTPAGRLDLATMGSLDFRPIDTERFGAVELAKRCIAMGGAAGCVLNAANEVAGRAFLDGRLGFTRIVPTIERVLDAVDAPAPASLADVMAIDAEAREHCERALQATPA